MQIIHIDHRKAELDNVGQKIIVRSGGHRKATIPMRLVERLVLTSSAKISATLLLKLNQQGTGVLILPSRYTAGKPLHITHANQDITLSQIQLHHATDLQKSLPIALVFIKAKLSAHQLLLTQLSNQHPRHASKLLYAANHLTKALKNLNNQSLDSPINTKDQLRGIEGAASAQFFKSWGKCFAPNLNFKTRNRRPPLDPVNVALSIGYTLAHHEALIAANTVGLNPHIGFLHDPLKNRDSLACDIVEATRPVIDRWVHNLFTTTSLKADHFTTTSSSCIAGKAGRKIMYNHYFETTAEHISSISIYQAKWLRDHLWQTKKPTSNTQQSPPEMITLKPDTTRNIP